MVREQDPSLFCEVLHASPEHEEPEEKLSSIKTVINVYYEMLVV